MNRLQFLLTKLAEEAAEISQIALKTQQFGLHEKQHKDGPSNRERIIGELNDFNAIIHLLNGEFNLGYHLTDPKNHLAMSAKIGKVAHYYEYSKSLGLVSDAE